MKRSEALAVGDILKAMMESGGDTATFDKQKLCYLWSEIAGPYINRHTSKRYIDGDTLHVFIDSGPLKGELQFMLTPLVEQLNNAVGKRIIKRIAIH
ncbi:MAG: DUF721 domain-containing protein [Muribaculum sp.]|nr:DUF721 domain-containing protein [Muribaculum sp.]